MAKKRSDFSDPLDDLLARLNSGAFVDSSVHEFSEVVNDTVKDYQSARRRTSKGTKSTYTRSTYKTVRPKIAPEVENESFTSRYQQVVACLNSITFTGYPQEKTDGYKTAIDRYLKLIEEHKNHLLPVEKQAEADLKTCYDKLRTVTVDGYTQGYYDALAMIRKVLFNSKLSRFSELSGKLN